MAPCMHAFPRIICSAYRLACLTTAACVSSQVLPAAALSTSAQASESSGAFNPRTAAAAFAGAAAAIAGCSLVASADEAEHGLHPAQMPWSHAGWFDSYDHSAIRRGHQVYQQVCAACHSVEYIHWRDLVSNGGGMAPLLWPSGDGSTACSLLGASGSSKALEEHCCIGMQLLCRSLGGRP